MEVTVLSSSKKTDDLVLYPSSRTLKICLCQPNSGQNFHLSVAKRLRKNLALKSPELLNLSIWIFYQDNTPPYPALSVPRFLTKTTITTSTHSPHLPSTTPYNFVSILRVIRNVKGKYFADINEVKRGAE